MISNYGDLGVKTRICVKPREIDIWVSGNILDRGVWEQEEVTAIMKMMDVYPEAVFLDLGANIGNYRQGWIRSQ